MAASSLRAPMVVRGRLPLDEGKRREVLTTIVASLERALAATADTARSQAEVRDELAGIKAVGQDETVVIHIRVGRSRLEVDVFPESESAAGEGDVEFRTWLLQRLRAEGLSQESAARRIGISTRTVGRWARGQTQPRMRDLSRVREALGELPSF